MRIAFVVITGILIGLAVRAQEGRGPGRGFFGPNIGFTTLDTNGDGTLDSAEIDAAPASLAKLDKNSDGIITQDEVRAALPAGRGRGRGRPGEGRGERQGDQTVNIADETVKTLMAFDTNGDGKLSRSELPERFQGIFDRGDENKDGYLTPDEIRKVAAAQAPPPENARPGGGGGFGGRGEMNLIRIDPILAALDVDGDGSISAEELRKSAAAIRKLDKDGDGKISREEAAPSFDRGRGF